MKDYYKILGISKTASQDEIKKAFRKLAKQYHPDVNKTDKNAEAKFKEINEAYDVLGNAEKKAEYDNGGSSAFSGFNDSNTSSGFSFNDIDLEQLKDLFGNAGFGNRTNSTFDFNSFKNEKANRNSFFDASSSSNAFNNFQNASKQSSSNANKIIADLQQQLEIANNEKNQLKAELNNLKSNLKNAFKDISLDTEIVIPLSYKQLYAGTPLSQQIRTENICNVCLGSGKVKIGSNTAKCNNCLGSGIVSKLEQITINIPFFANSNNKILAKTIANKGKILKIGNDFFYGNLNIFLQLEESDFFFIKNGLLHEKVYLDPLNALIGIDNLKVPSLAGTLTISVPANTSNNDTNVVYDKGLKDTIANNSNIATTHRNNLILVFKYAKEKMLTETDLKKLKTIANKTKNNEDAVSKTMQIIADL